MTEEEWSTQEVVKATDITSRPLRHYDRIALLPPSRTGYGGQRFYDRGGLLRLQQILVLRELGLGLAGIGRVLDEGRAAADVLREHLAQLEQEHERLDRITQSVRSTSASSTKEVNSWQSRSSTGSTIRSTARRSSSAGASRPTPTPTPGGARSRRTTRRPSGSSWTASWPTTRMSPRRTATSAATRCKI